jgi:hypothetical protein
VHKSTRLCENSDAKPSNPIFAQFWPVLSDQNQPIAKIRSDRAHFQTKREFSHDLQQFRSKSKTLKIQSIFSAKLWCKTDR